MQQLFKKPEKGTLLIHHGLIHHVLGVDLDRLQVVLWKVIIVSPLSLSLRDNEIER